MTGGVLSVGRVYCDLVFTDLAEMPTPGQEIFAGSLHLLAGGGAYITAAYLAALGRPSALCARLPAPPFATLVQDEATANGIDLGACTADGAAPQITVAMVVGGDRAFLTRREGAALPEDWREALTAPGLSHLHIGEVTTLLEFPGLIAAARRAGLTISLDCGWDDAAFAAPELPALIGQVDLFLPNSSEAKRLAPLGPIATLAPLVVVKEGAEGATALSNGVRHHAPATPTKVVDTTGAGDAFNAGFLDGWLDGAPVPDCLRLGTACGAVAVARHGGAGQLGPLRGLGAKLPRDAAE